MYFIREGVDFKMCKKYIMVIGIISIICVLFLCGCEVKVNSLEDARTVLLQATSDLSEVQEDIKERNSLTEKELKSYQDKVDECKVKIDAAEDYCVDDLIKEKYESANKLYNKVNKSLDKFAKKLEKFEKEKK